VLKRATKRPGVTRKHSSGPLPPAHVIDKSRIGLIEVLVVSTVLPVSPDATYEALDVLPRVAREIKTLEGKALCRARRQLGLVEHNMSVDNRVMLSIRQPHCLLRWTLCCSVDEGCLSATPQLDLDAPRLVSQHDGRNKEH